jgi:hypothetical protein
VESRGPGIDPERLFQRAGRPCVLASGQCHAAQAAERRDTPRLERPSPGKPCFGVGVPVQRQVRVTQPDQRRDIVRAQPQSPFERRDRFVAGALLLIKMSEEIRPAGVGGCEQLGVQETRLGRLAEVGRHEQLPELPIGCRALQRRPRRVLAAGHERRIGRPDLILDRGRRLRHIGESDRAQLWNLGGFVGRLFLRLAGGHSQEDDDDRGGARAHLPVPCFSVVQRSIGTSAHSSLLPSGQVTRTRTGSAESPRPTSTLGSFADA